MSTAAIVIGGTEATDCLEVVYGKLVAGEPEVGRMGCTGAVLREAVGKDMMDTWWARCSRNSVFELVSVCLNTDPSNTKVAVVKCHKDARVS